MKILLLFFALTLHLCVSAQYYNIDSLKRELTNAKDDTTKIDLLLEIDIQYADQNKDSILKYTKQALAIAENISDIKRIGICYGYLANDYTLQQKYPLAIEYNRKATEQFRQINHVRGILRSKAGLAYIYSKMNDLDNLYKINKEVYQLALINNDKYLIQYSLQGISGYYNSKEAHDSCKYYALKGLKHATDFEDDYFATHFKFTLASCYFSLNEEINAATEYTKQNIKLMMCLII
jgi:hypothetical protein